MNSSRVLVFIVILTLFSASLFFTHAVTSSSDQTQDFSVTLKSNDYTFSQKDNEGYQKINELVYTELRNSGDPELPIEVYHILLPPGAQVQDLEIVSTEKESLGTGYKITPTPQPKLECVDGICSSEFEKMSPNVEIYESNQVYPSETIEFLEQDQLRKYDVLRISFTPIQYNPVTEEVSVIEEVTIKVNYVLGDKTNKELGDTAMDAEVRNLVVNYEQFGDEYQTEMKSSSIYDYVIIAPRQVATSQGIANLVTHRQSQGYSVHVEQFEDIKKDYSGLDDAEKLRNYLIATSSTWGYKYVTLVGSYQTIPMRYCYWIDPYTQQPDVLPTDWYYNDLTGSWSYVEELCGYGVSRYADVYVGRITLDSKNDVGAYVSKLISYEQSGDAYKKDALLAAGTIIGLVDMCHSAEDIKNNAMLPNGYSTITMYETDGTCPCDAPADQTLNRNNVVSSWSSDNYGLVYLDGHGNAYWTSSQPCGEPSNDFFSSTDVSLLNGNYPSMIFNGACETAKPETSSIGISMIDQLKAVSYIGASRSTWTSGGKEMPYFDNLLNYNYPNAKALALGKSSPLSYNRDNVLSFNLYGDSISTTGDEIVDISWPPSDLHLVNFGVLEIKGTVIGPDFDRYVIEWIDEYDYTGNWNTAGVTLIDGGLSTKIEDVLGTWEVPSYSSKFRFKLTGYFIGDTKYDYTTVETVITIGSFGTGDGQFVSPEFIESDDGEVYVTDEFDGRVQVFDETGNFLRKWDIGAKATGITIDDSEVFVLQSYDWIEYDPGVKVFDKQGTPLRSWGSLGSGDGQFAENPKGIDVNGNEIFVVDTYNNRIQVFDKQGNFLRKWGQLGESDGDFSHPWDVAVTNAEVFVSDTTAFPDAVNNRIQVFDKQGNFLRKWQYSFNKPKGISIRGYQVHVTDEGNDKIKVFDKQGNFIRDRGQSSGPGSFSAPYDVSVTSNRAFIIDHNGWVMKIFGLSTYDYYKCGDLDASEFVDALDVGVMIDYLFAGGADPDPMKSGDMNGDGTIDALDLGTLIDYVFSGIPHNDACKDSTLSG
ncbi:MAG: C25 family cysteine peptidase [Candidatus Aenigmatarchaeota archaeon]